MERAVRMLRAMCLLEGAGRRERGGGRGEEEGKGRERGGGRGREGRQDVPPGGRAPQLLSVRHVACRVLYTRTPASACRLIPRLTHRPRDTHLFLQRGSGGAIHIESPESYSW